MSGLKLPVIFIYSYARRACFSEMTQDVVVSVLNTLLILTLRQ